MLSKKLYKERYRPQFHFTAKQNWLNDPNGLVFYDGEYHLFFQHNPDAKKWGNMTWGHAVSPDLIYWQQLPHAIQPYNDGTIFSGSAVVDLENFSGFAKEKKPVIIAFFTHAREPFGQSIAFSSDKGRAWNLYQNGAHVIQNQDMDKGERDPKVFWHKRSRKWIMVLWTGPGRCSFFASDDLKEWSLASSFQTEHFYECPDFFELPVNGALKKTKWILHDASFKYWVGAFDGRSFLPEAGPLQGDFGKNFYAAQTWNNTYPRVIQIAWMRDGKYPGMPFNQQMSFPCELKLKTSRSGYKLMRYPVAEIKKLYDRHYSISGKLLKKDESFVPDIQNGLFDICLELEVKEKTNFEIRFYGISVSYRDHLVSCLGKTAPLLPADNSIKIRLLIDRTSVELFGNDGELSMSSCFLPKNIDTHIEFRSNIGKTLIRNLTLHTLRSIWDRKV